MEYILSFAGDIFATAVTLALIGLSYIFYYGGARLFMHDPNTTEGTEIRHYGEYLGIGFLTLLPALFYILMVAQLSTRFHHPIPGWAGMLGLSLSLALPFLIAAEKPPVPQKTVASRHHYIFRLFLAIACIAAAAYGLTQIRLFTHYDRAEGKITQKIPTITYSSRISKTRIHVRIEFTDYTGKKQYFTQSAYVMPGKVGDVVGVYYRASDPGSEPMPDLGGWELAQDLQIMLIVLFLLRAGYVGLKPSTPPLQPAATAPAPAPPVKKTVYKKKRSKHPQIGILDDLKAALPAMLAQIGHSCKGSGYFEAIKQAGPHAVLIHIDTLTDAERDRMDADPKVTESIRAFLREKGYPPDAIHRIGIRAESQETVDRDWDGNWYQALR